MHRAEYPADGKQVEGNIDILEEWNISKPGKEGFANPNSFCFVKNLTVRKSKSCELRHCFMLLLILQQLLIYLIFVFFLSSAVEVIYFLRNFRGKGCSYSVN